MRELRSADIQHRVKGRPALERRLMGLLRAVHRYARCRAATREDTLWAAPMLDGLAATLDAARRPPESPTR
jgi:hypothetical protein